MTAAFVSWHRSRPTADGGTARPHRLGTTWLLSSSGSSSAPGPYRRRRNPNAKHRKKKPRLGLLTFDLDGTLFPTRAVVQHANQRLVEHLAMEGYKTTVDDYLASARAVRTRWESDHAGQPLSYTELRKRAVEAELRRVSENPYLSFDEIVESSSEVWEHERHAAAEYYLPLGVVNALHDIRKHFGENLCIGAITNGLGNPLKMPSLAPFFSFCVSGEDPDVFPHRKPHPEIYRRAMHIYKTEHYVPSQDDDAQAEEMGAHSEPPQDFLWCHVGDCLANDVGASADCGAFAVWCAPDPQAAVSAAAATDSASLMGLAAQGDGTSGGGAEPPSASSSPSLLGPSADPGKGSKAKPPPLQPSWSTATQDELERRNELAHQAQEKISAHIYHIPQLLEVLKQVARPDRRAKLQRRRW
jgi:FMN phosphatase YigB (HAD superfamily)